MKLERGATLLDGRYRLERRLGAGGMATVWLARDLSLSRPVAIKVIADVLAADEDYRARFEREARTAAKLSHPNLVRIYDLEDTEDRPLLIMQYVEGGTLAERMQRRLRKRIDLEQLARQLLDALGFIHQAGIVHRDVKPENVLIARDGRYLLTDFGIAQLEGATRITQTGELIGTTRYIAPEVRAGAPATPVSDLYACGLVLRDCGGDSSTGTMRQLIDEMTRPDPAGRPRSAHEALAALDPGAATAAATRTVPIAARARARLGNLRLLRARDVRIRLSPLTAIAATVCAVVAMIAAIALIGESGERGSSDGDSAGPAELLAPEGAPADEQLDGLARLVEEAGGG